MTIIKGQKFSKETKLKMSLVRTGKKCSEITKIKISNSLKGRTISEVRKSKLSECKMGSKNPNWKGGIKIAHNGYILINSPNHPFRNCRNYVYEHRLVMEKILNRYLTKDEIVHHSNGIRNDNRPKNLDLVPSQPEHWSLTRLIKENKRLKEKIKELEKPIVNPD